jgi:steroid 5-alpha reductase family enzyme
MRNRRAAVLVSVAVYAAAFAVAIAAVRLFRPIHPLAVVAVGDVAATCAVFVASVLVDNSSMYDPYWSVAPVVIAGYYLWTAPGAAEARMVLAATLVFAYSLRLTANFYRGWPGLAKEDFRYERFRRRFPRAYWPVSLVGIHLFPTVMVYLGCLPLYAVSRGGGAPFGVVDMVAALVTAGAVLLAFVADEQLRRFRSDPANAGESMRGGLWARSRHPNYLGEIFTWWGLYLFALAAGRQWWWTGAGALAITLMFVYVSTPLMEERALATRAGYLDYVARTPRLLPFRFRLRTK